MLHPSVMNHERVERSAVTDARRPRFGSFDGLVCALLVGVCLLLTWPMVEIGINDDWCYTMVAWDFGHTGHFIYRGWASASVGWQAIWGGLAARWLGYTYTVVRLSMWPIGLATVVLYHAILRRFGLRRQHAILGTLTLVLSPLFLPLVDTFMTDIPGLFVLFLCLYLCQRAIASSTENQALGWLAAAALTNIALGTVRQIAWLGVLVIVPCCAFLLRHWKRVRWATAAFWIFALVCIMVNMHWFKYQPYTAPEAIVPRNFDSKAWLKVVANAWECALTLPFLCLPVLVNGLALLPKLSRRSQRLFGVVAGILLLCAAWAPGRKLLIRLSPPWTGNVLNRQGIMQGGLLFGPSRAIAPAWLALALFVFVLSCLAFVLMAREVVPGTAGGSAEPGTCNLWQATVLLLPFAAAYCLLLFPRATQFVLFDRYLLALIAVALVFLLRLHQDRVADHLPLISYGVLAVFAFLATAGTHDLFAMERARVEVFDLLEHRGVPATAIRGGFELDAATQVNSWGYFNDPRILVPRTAFHPQAPRTPSATYPECNYPLQEFVPAVQPRYALAADDSRCLVGDTVASAPYRTWIPVATHEILAAAPRFP